MKPRILSLFAGYGGLSLAVEEFFGGELVCYSEFDPAPSKNCNICGTGWYKRVLRRLRRRATDD